MIINSISYDFPFKINNEVRLQSPPSKPPIKFSHDLRNSFNNESPDFFRLDAMKENPLGYKNPFLDEVIPVDRHHFLKEFSKTREHIRLIDKIKMRKEWSQDSNYLKLVKGKNDRDLMNKRLNKINDKPNSEKNYIQYDENDKRYNEKLSQLTNYSPKHNFNVKNTFRPGASFDSNCKISLEIDPKASTYLNNYNTYIINGNDRYNEKDFLCFRKKDSQLYNCIIDEKTDVVPDVYVSPKWSKYYENYLLLKDSKKGFLIKGGLFTEFANKNKGTYDMKRVIKEQESKMPNYPVIKVSQSVKNKESKKISLYDQARKVVETNNLNKVRDIFSHTNK